MLGLAPNTSGLNRATRQLANAYGPAGWAAGRSLETGETGAIDAYNQALQQQTGTLQGSVAPQVGALSGGGQSAIGALMGGEQEALGLTGAGIAPWESLWSQYAPGAGTYWDALGVGGGAGADAASAAFNASPFGRQLQTNLGTVGEALARGAGTTGQTGQGYIQGAQAVTGMTDEAMQNWLQSLYPAIQGQQTAAGGIQQGFGQAAGIPSQFAPEMAGVYTGTGTGVANVYGQTAQDLAAAQQAAGQGIAGSYGQFAPLQAQLNWQRILGGPQARVQGAGNVLGAQQAGNQSAISLLTGLADAAAKGAGAFYGA